MGKRLLGSEICYRSPTTADRRCRQKLQEVVRRHEECRMAFQGLRTQIKSGLLEASDVFISLSIPLMKLVGLKEEEMAAAGKSNTIIIDSSEQTQHRSPIPLKSNGSDRGNVVSPDKEVISYSAQAEAACKEIQERQRLITQCLVGLLRHIGLQLNAREESIHRGLDSAWDSFRHFVKQAASYISSMPRAGPLQMQPDVTRRFVAKVLHASYEHVSSALEDVEEEADALLRSLAESTRGPMVAHIRELQADAGGGGAVRLAALVGEMEAAMRELRVETAAARKRARVAEEERAEAVRVCREMQGALMGVTVVGSRDGRRRHTPVSRSHRLTDRETNGLRVINGRETSTPSTSSSKDHQARMMSRQLVVAKTRETRHAAATSK